MAMMTTKLKMAGDEGKTSAREEEAREYLQKHRILELFSNLTSQLIYERPGNPVEYLVEVLEKLKKSRTTSMDYPCLFDDKNIQSVFSMLDPTGRGHITLKQYREALKTLGIEEFEELPPGGEEDRITLNTFMSQAKIGLVKTSATFDQSDK